MPSSTTRASKLQVKEKRGESKGRGGEGESYLCVLEDCNPDCTTNLFILAILSALKS
jgi:hypothetical protein